jgi:CRP-like cAMP-binding protein
MTFQVVAGDQCSVYQNGDVFRLSGSALLLDFEKDKSFVTTAVVKPPSDRKTCRTLIGHLTQLLIEHESVDNIPARKIRCSGCEGYLEIAPHKRGASGSVAGDSAHPQKIDLIAGMLHNFSIFQSLDRHNLKNLVAYLKVKRFAPGDIVLRKGAPAQNLYIILSGAVDVLDEDGSCLSTLTLGDVFGEMSLISGDPVGATIRVVEPAVIMYIRGKDFKHVLNKFPSIQLYLARMLAQRLARSNIVRAQQLSSGMTGNLSDISPSELFQTLNLNQKSGRLSLSLPRGAAALSFHRGELVRAEYNQQQGKLAFYQVLAEIEGRFTFTPRITDEERRTAPIGTFMELILDGLKQIDEQVFVDEAPGQNLSE